MSNESKNLLSKYLKNNNSFLIQKKWKLKDGSNLMLFRRNSINSYLSKSSCSKDLSNINIKQIKWIQFKPIGKGKVIKTSNFLIDFVGKDFKKFVNISPANGFFHRDFDEESCNELSQNISLDFPQKTGEIYLANSRIINNEGVTKKLHILKNIFQIDKKYHNDKSIQMVNRLSEVEKLGKYLSTGEFENLFNLVGVINQSDPKQIYLKNAENAYLQRYRDNKNLSNLYSILISQILQKKIKNAEETINLIVESDPKNGNAYLTKAIINVYLLDKKDARLSINKAKLLEKI